MDSKHIISFERGTLYLKLREEYDCLYTSRMQIHTAIARIDRAGMQVVKGDSTLDVEARSMTLSLPELKLIIEGYEMVKHFWKESPLPHRHVLLDCGCIQSWDELIEARCAHGLDQWLWCGNHEEVKVYRYNAADFPEIAEQAQEAVSVEK